MGLNKNLGSCTHHNEHPRVQSAEPCEPAGLFPLWSEFGWLSPSLPCLGTLDIGISSDGHCLVFNQENKEGRFVLLPSFAGQNL